MEKLTALPHPQTAAYHKDPGKGTITLSNYKPFVKATVETVIEHTHMKERESRISVTPSPPPDTASTNAMPSLHDERDRKTFISPSPRRLPHPTTNPEVPQLPPSPPTTEPQSATMSPTSLISSYMDTSSAAETTQPTSSAVKTEHHSRKRHAPTASSDKHSLGFFSFGKTRSESRKPAERRTEKEPEPRAPSPTSSLSSSKHRRIERQDPLPPPPPPPIEQSFDEAPKPETSKPEIPSRRIEHTYYTLEHHERFHQDYKSKACPYCNKF
jgi:hypothetical protein